MSRKLYLAGLIHKEKKVNVMGITTELKQSWADGMIGVIPVFKDYESALKYVEDDEDLVREFTAVPNLSEVKA